MLSEINQLAPQHILSWCLLIYDTLDTRDPAIYLVAIDAFESFLKFLISGLELIDREGPCDAIIDFAKSESIPL